MVRRLEMKREKILCLHGFLGNPKQFDFLKEDFEVFPLKLDELVGLSFEDMNKKINEQYPELPEMSVLGYSFGSRLGARIFLENKMQGHYIGLTGHVGLDTQEERNDRKKFEDKIIGQLFKLKESEFLDFWNGYDIFKSDTPILLKDACFKNAQDYFLNYGLSMQPNLMKELRKKKERVHFFFGEKDKKYVSYANQKLGDMNVTIMKNKAHRLINSKTMVLEICRTILCN